MLFPYLYSAVYRTVCCLQFDIRLPHADYPMGRFSSLGKLGDSAGQLLRQSAKTHSTSLHLLPLSSLTFSHSSSSPPLDLFADFRCLSQFRFGLSLVTPSLTSLPSLQYPNPAGYSLIRRHVLQQPAKAPPLHLPVRCWCCRGCV